MLDLYKQLSENSPDIETINCTISTREEMQQLASALIGNTHVTYCRVTPTIALNKEEQLDFDRLYTPILEIVYSNRLKKSAQIRQHRFVQLSQEMQRRPEYNQQNQKTKIFILDQLLTSSMII